MQRRRCLIISVGLGMGLLAAGLAIGTKVNNCGALFWKNPDCSPKLCLQTGGQYRPNLGFGVRASGCYYLPKDHRRKCYQDSDCEHFCIFISTQNVDADGYIFGECGATDNCYRTIPLKTKDMNDLKANFCWEP